MQASAVSHRPLARVPSCRLLPAVFVLLAAALSACSSNDDDLDGNACQPNDQDGVIGGRHVVMLTVSDDAFAVGGVGSGSTQRNITIQNSSEVMLTLVNVGTTPHSFVIDCIDSELPSGCPQTSCFPPEAQIAPLDPGASATIEFVTPAVEGAYPFRSDVPGDEELIGRFVLN